MDYRRLSLAYGSRTRKNVLKGKSIRKQNDGADNFADYWTDSDAESTSSTIGNKCSDVPQTQQARKTSETRLDTLRQNVRISQNSEFSHIDNKIKNNSQLTKSPGKSAKNNTLITDKDDHRSGTQKQKLHPNHHQDIYNFSAGIMSNSYASSEDSLGREESDASSSRSMVLRRQSENPAVSPLHRNIKNVSDTSCNVQTSKSSNEDEHINLNKSQHSANVTSENMEHIVRSSEKEKNASISPKRSLRLRNFNDSKNGNESGFFHFPKYDTNDVSKYAKNTISPLLERNDKRRKTSVVHESDLDINLNSSDINILSFTKIITKETDSTDTAVPVHPSSDKTLNDINNSLGHRDQVSKMSKTSLGNRTVKKKKNSSRASKIFHKYDEYDAEIIQMAQDNENLFSTEKNPPLTPSPGLEPDKENSFRSSISKSVREIDGEEADMCFNKAQNSHNSVSSNKIWTRSKQNDSELRNEINAELFEEAVSGDENPKLPAISNDTSRHNHKSQTENNLSSKSVKFFTDSSKDDRNSNASSFGRKSNVIKSVLKRKSSVLTQTSAKKRISSNVDQNRPHSHLNISEMLTKSAHVNGNETGDSSGQIDRVERGNVFHNQEIEKANASHISDSDEEPAFNFDNSKEAQNGKANSKSKALKSLSNVNLQNAAEIPEVENEPTSRLGNKRKKSLNKASETVSRGSAESVADIPERENETSQNLDNKGKKCVIKANKKLRTSSRDIIESPAKIPEREKEIDENPSLRKKRINKTYEKLNTTKSFSGDRENAVEIPEVVNSISPNLNGKRKKRANRTNEKLKASETFSKTNKGTNEGESRSTSGVDSNQNKHVNESTSNRNDYDQPALPSRKKKNTTVQSSGEIILRKSKRKKFPPLAVWRNERILYRVEQGIINYVGIDEGTGEDAGSIQQLNQLRRKKAIEKKKKKPKKFVLKDVVENKNVCVSLLKKFDYVPWDEGFQNDECPYRIKKVFETLNSASGFIQIEIGKEKPMQYMPKEDIYLSVMKGKVEVIIGDNISEAGEKDMIIIPRSVPYSIKNIGVSKAVLVFCVGRFQYLESQP